MNNRTFAIIKPDAVKNGDTGKIYDRILKADFNILSAKLLRMTKTQAKELEEDLSYHHLADHHAIIKWHARSPFIAEVGLLAGAVPVHPNRYRVQGPLHQEDAPGYRRYECRR